MVFVMTVAQISAVFAMLNGCLFWHATLVSSPQCAMLSVKCFVLVLFERMHAIYESLIQLYVFV